MRENTSTKSQSDVITEKTSEIVHIIITKEILKEFMLWVYLIFLSMQI